MHKVYEMHDNVNTVWVSWPVMPRWYLWSQRVTVTYSLLVIICSVCYEANTVRDIMLMYKIQNVVDIHELLLPRDYDLKWQWLLQRPSSWYIIVKIRPLLPRGACVRCLVSATVIIYIICICVVRALVLYPRSCRIEFRLWWLMFCFIRNSYHN